MKIFLGGTCNDSNWRDYFIKLIEPMGIDYFNPVVDNWTPDCQKNEIIQRKTCDICLYTITPKMTGVYSIAEVVDDSNKKPNNTVLILLKTYDESVFNDGQWRSLQSVANLVSKNGASVFYNMRDFVSKLDK